MRRDWRRRGLATHLKRAELAWAAAHGIRLVYTWTQRGNDGMRALDALGMKGFEHQQDEDVEFMIDMIQTLTV